MQNVNTFGVCFLLRQNKTADDQGRFPIYAKISVNNSKAELGTRVYVKPGHWNKGKGCIKPLTNDLKKQSTHLEKVRAKLTAIFRDMELNDEHLHAVTVKAKYLNRDTPEKKLTLSWLIKEHNNKMVGTLKRGTLKNYDTTLVYIENYLKTPKFNGDILLRHLKYEFIEDLKTYILANPVKEHDPCTNNGVMKHLERLKKIMRWAAKKNKWISESPFEGFELKYDPTDIKFLTKDQLDNLEAYPFTKPRLQLLRHLFIFSCYTGLAYVDLMELGPEDIKTDVQDRMWLYTRREKSQKKADIPVLPPAAALIEKYRSNPLSIERQKIFPYVSNQDVNRILKVIAELLKLPFDLNFHVARHTFATLLIMYGVPVTTVQKIMGHTKLSTTMTYVHLLNGKVAEDMEEFWLQIKKGKRDQKNSKPKISPLLYNRNSESV